MHAYLSQIFSVEKFNFQKSWKNTTTDTNISFANV